MHGSTQHFDNCSEPFYLSHKIGHFHKVCQSRKRGRRAHLVQTAPPQTEQDTHINENGVRQPNPPMVNMLNVVFALREQNLA